MSINFTPDTYAHAMWFAGNGREDVLSALLKRDGEPWRFIYRFRYYEDEQAHDSADRKSWYAFEIPAETPVEEILANLQPMLDILQVRFGPLDYVDLRCRGDDPKVVFEISSRPWGNPKFEKITTENTESRETRT